MPTSLPDDRSKLKGGPSVWNPSRLSQRALLFLTTALALIASNIWVANVRGDVPVVTSGTLVANFEASATTVAVDGSNNVTSWSATNDNSITLNSFGVTAGNIKFDASAMNGNASIVVNDFNNQNQVLRGSLGLTGSLSESTIFWLGYFDPGRNGTSGDSLGQYVYSFGRDGSDGSQMDLQTDDGHIELFGGNGNDRGDDIGGLSSIYTVWRAEYGGPSGSDDSGQAVFANGVDLNLPMNNGGDFSIAPSHDFQLFGFQNSSGTSSGFNFVGNTSQIIVYDGILSAADTAQVQNYLSARVNAVPEPGSMLVLIGAMTIGIFRRRRTLSSA